MYDPIWITADGRQLRVSEMETAHIELCIARIERSRRGWRRSFLGRLRLELEIRALT